MVLLEKIFNTKTGLTGLTYEGEEVSLCNPMPGCKVMVYEPGKEGVAVDLLKLAANNDQRKYYQIGWPVIQIIKTDAVQYIPYCSYSKKAI